jgi:hypothetical protein
VAIRAQSAFVSGRRQHGGPIEPWQVVTVGEAGPEPVVFGQQGQALSHNEALDIFREVARGGGRGGTTSIVINEVTQDPRELAHVIGALIGRDASS